MMPKKAGIAGIDISKPLQSHNILDFRSNNFLDFRSNAFSNKETES